MFFFSYFSSVFTINGRIIFFSKQIRLKDENIELHACVNIYFRECCLLLVLNLTNETIQENKEIEAKENIKKMSA